MAAENVGASDSTNALNELAVTIGESTARRELFVRGGRGTSGQLASTGPMNEFFGSDGAGNFEDLGPSMGVTNDIGDMFYTSHTGDVHRVITR